MKKTGGGCAICSLKDWEDKIITVIPNSVLEGIEGGLDIFQRNKVTTEAVLESAETVIQVGGEQTVVLHPCSVHVQPCFNTPTHRKGGVIDNVDVNFDPAGIITGSRINTGTFTRPKKNKTSPIATTNADNVKENVESIHHTNVADIENLAKMQEESLRQSIAQTSPRRGFKSRPLPNVAASNNMDSNSVSPANSNRSSPAHLEEASYRRNSQNSVESDQSSPPDSPYGSSQQLHVYSSGVQSLRGSVPNVSRLIPRAQHHNSDTSLADYQTEEQAEPPRCNRLQSSLVRPSSPSVSGLKQPKNIRGASPQRSGLPTPRRSIPQPGSVAQRSPGLQAPKRISGLPAPRLSQAKQKDESWREGCF